MKINQLVAAAAISLLSAAPVSAGVIDLIGLPGNFDQATFGASGTEHYAQSLEADDVNLAELVFGIIDSEGGSFKVQVTESRAAGLPGTGTAPDASGILWEQTLDHLGGGLQWFTVNPDVATSVGSVYFMNLNAFSQSLVGARVRATAFNGGTDAYTGGEFIFSNTNSDLSNTLSWSSRFSANQDLAVRAVFNGGSNEVPAPGTLLLIAAGLFGVRLFGRKSA